MRTVLNLDRLLDPISEEHPAGSYLKSDPACYRPLRNSYNVAQTSFRKLTNNPDPALLDELQQENRENWQQLAKQLQDTLLTRSKDLECASWLTIAHLFSEQPYQRLVQCLQLLKAFLQTYGAAVHPCPPDEKLKSTQQADQAAERANLQLRPLVQLFGESEESGLLGTPLKVLPLLGNIDFVYWRSQERQGNRAELQETAKQVLADDQESVKNRILAIDQALKALAELDQAVAEFSQSNGAGTATVSSRFLREQLQANLNGIRTLTEGLLKPWPLDEQKASISHETGQAQGEIAQGEIAQEKTKAPDPVSQVNSEQQQEVETTAPPDTQLPQAIQENGVVKARPEPIYNRNQAFQQLRLLSNYFARTEPQSPVSYLLEKAIRWGYTPLPELIDELAKGQEAVIQRVSELTGMNNKDKCPIPGSPAQGLVPPPTHEPVAPSQQNSQQEIRTTVEDLPRSPEKTTQAQKLSQKVPTINQPEDTPTAKKGVNANPNQTATDNLPKPNDNERESEKAATANNLPKFINFP